MPELPEVETIRRHLAPHVEGRTLERAGDPRPALVPPARARASSPTRSRAARVERLGRRGKYLVWELSGRRLPARAPAHDRHAAARPGRRRAHKRVLVRPRRPPARLRRPAPLRHRRAGARPGRARRVLRRAARRRAARATTSPASTCTRSRAPRARRSRRSCSTRSASPASATSTPTRRCSAPASTRCGPANRLTRAQCAALRDAVVDSLEAGLEAKGATIDDFRDPYGVSGTFQDQFLIHLREGEPCTNCGSPMRKLRAAGRGTYVCERCQPRAAGGVGARPRLKSARRAGAVGRDELLVAADRLAVDDDLGERHHSGQTHELRTTLRGPWRG